MNLYYLRYFVVLAKMEHYTRAAAKLNITQPSLSHAISSIESELGVALFDRVGRNVALTKYGKQFLVDVERSLEILDRGVERIQQVGSGYEDIELGFLPGMGATMVAETVSAFQATPEGAKSRFHFYSDTTPNLLKGLEEQKYDLVLCAKTDNALLSFSLVSREPYYLAVPEGHPLASRDKIKLSETLEYPHIMFSKNTGIRPEVDKIYARLEKKPVIAYEIQEDQDIAGLVAHRFGVAVLPKIKVLESLPVRLIPLEEEEIQRELWVATLKGHYLSPAVKAFCEFVARYTEEKAGSESL